MPAQTLPTISRAELASHNSKTSCYVAIGDRVFDVTDFLADHPGGEDLVLDYAGKDISVILEDEVSHKHSEAAYEILEEYVVGTLDENANDDDSTKPQNGSSTTKPNGTTKTEETGLASEADLSKETDFAEDYKKHKFIDLNKPMFMQVWRSDWSRDFYLEQVHKPRYYKGGASAPFFGNFLEPLSKAPWYVVPMVWVPAISYGLYRAYEDIQNVPLMVMNFFIGVCAWTLIEYTLHRGLFHLDEYVLPKSLVEGDILANENYRRMPDNRVFITLHFLLHGVHHYLPSTSSSFRFFPLSHSHITSQLTFSKHSGQTPPRHAPCALHRPRLPLLGRRTNCLCLPWLAHRDESLLRRHIRVHPLRLHALLPPS